MPVSMQKNLGWKKGSSPASHRTSRLRACARGCRSRCRRTSGGRRAHRLRLGDVLRRGARGELLHVGHRHVLLAALVMRRAVAHHVPASLSCTRTAPSTLYSWRRQNLGAHRRQRQASPTCMRKNPSSASPRRTVTTETTDRSELAPVISIGVTWWPRMYRQAEEPVIRIADVRHRREVGRNHPD